MTTTWVRWSEIKDKYPISKSWLRKWALKGEVNFITLPGGTSRYSKEDIDALFVKDKKSEETDDNRI